MGCILLFDLLWIHKFACRHEGSSLASSASVGRPDAQGASISQSVATQGESVVIVVNGVTTSKLVSWQKGQNLSFTDTPKTQREIFPRHRARHNSVNLMLTMFSRAPSNSVPKDDASSVLSEISQSAAVKSKLLFKDRQVVLEMNPRLSFTQTVQVITTMLPATLMSKSVS